MRQHTLNNNGDITTYATRAEYDAAVAILSPNDAAKIARRVEISKEEVLCSALIDDILDEFKRMKNNGTMTTADCLDVYQRIRDVFVCLGAITDLQAARIVCSNTATGGAFTAGRKTFLLNLIDSYIAQL